MGFKATEQVEALTYDFRPYADLNGTIAEPTTPQIEAYRSAVIDGIKASGLDPALLTGDGEASFSLEDLDAAMEKSGALEESLLKATGDLTGLTYEALADLPYRISRAFLGWIMGLFFNPEG